MSTWTQILNLKLQFYDSWELLISWFLLVCLNLTFSWHQFAAIMFLILRIDFSQVFCLFNWVMWYFFIFSKQEAVHHTELFTPFRVFINGAAKANTDPSFPSQSHQMQTVQKKKKSYRTIYPTLQLSVDLFQSTETWTSILTLCYAVYSRIICILIVY